MIEERIQQLGYTLPDERVIPDQFINILIYENVAYVSGTLPWVDGELLVEGKVGDTVSVEEGYRCAAQCILNALGNLKAKIDSLDKVKQIIKMTGYVASTTDFVDQADVMNGATDLLVEIFGAEKGTHARAAVGAAVMPANTPVELEMIIALEN